MIGENRLCPRCLRLTMVHCVHLPPVKDEQGNIIQPAWDVWQCTCGYMES